MIFAPRAGLQCLPAIQPCLLLYFYATLHLPSLPPCFDVFKWRSHLLSTDICGVSGVWRVSGCIEKQQHGAIKGSCKPSYPESSTPSPSCSSLTLGMLSVFILIPSLFWFLYCIVTAFGRTTHGTQRHVPTGKLRRLFFSQQAGRRVCLTACSQLRNLLRWRPGAFFKSWILGSDKVALFASSGAEGLLKYQMRSMSSVPVGYGWCIFTSSHGKAMQDIARMVGKKRERDEQAAVYLQSRAGRARKGGFPPFFRRSLLFRRHLPHIPCS